MRTLVAAVVLLAPVVAFAQTSDAGVTFIPARFQYLGEPPVCCPASGWLRVGFGAGFRFWGGRHDIMNAWRPCVLWRRGP